MAKRKKARPTYDYNTMTSCPVCGGQWLTIPRLCFMCGVTDVALESEDVKVLKARVERENAGHPRFAEFFPLLTDPGR